MYNNPIKIDLSNEPFPYMVFVNEIKLNGQYIANENFLDSLNSFLTMT